MAVFTSVPAPRAGELTLEEAASAGLRTEPWVNERYLITYRGEGEPPVLWVRFHQDQLAARQDHRVQLYLPADHFPGVAVAARAPAGGGRGGRGARSRPRPAIGSGGGRSPSCPCSSLVALGTLGVAARKLKGLARAYATAPDVLWERDDWEPPRLRLQTFRKPGKVAELTDIEALTLLGLPFQVILAMVLDALVARGRLRRETREGALWLARNGDAPPENEPYQGFVWEELGRGDGAGARGARRAPRRGAGGHGAAQGLGRRPRRHPRALPPPLRGDVPRRGDGGGPALRRRPTTTVTTSPGG